MNSQEKLIERWKDKTKILGFSPEYVAFWRYVDDLIDNQKRLPKENERLNNIINQAIESLNYYIDGMNESLEIWNKVRENEKIETDTLLQMLEREKQNYIDVLNILKGSDSNE